MAIRGDKVESGRRNAADAGCAVRLWRPQKLRSKLLAYGLLVAVAGAPLVVFLLTASDEKESLTWDVWLEHIWPVLLLVAVLFVPLWVFLVRSILRPLEAVVAASNAVETGNRDGRDIPSHLIPDHELGDLIRARQAMLERLDAAEARFRRRLRDLSVLTSGATLLKKTGGLEPALTEVLDAILRVGEADAAELSVLDRSSGELHVRVQRGFSRAWEEAETRRPMHDCVCGNGVLAGGPVVINDISEDQRASRIACLRDGFRSIVCLPIRSGDRSGGVLSVHRRSRPFSANDVDLLIAVSVEVALVLENLELYQDAVRLAITDGLTGLYTRRYVVERAEEQRRRAKRSGLPFSLMMVDLDHFKAYNDRHGHVAGDHLLRDIASVLSRETRGGDVVGRYGGDEFVALLPDTPKAEAVVVAERMRAAIASQVQRDGPVRGLVGASLGVATFPDDASGVDALLEAADAALYRAKRGGRAHVAVAGRNSAGPAPHGSVSEEEPPAAGAGLPGARRARHGSASSSEG